ncbi:PREDICTED: uncharacterized protein LOC108378368 [Rhagoletis zephyria]|uniref:uncharacterized protein LOC108378368 n=1 Tax=Rhagoletis zephyria TaxID=28612 RepID=UPI00081140DB|nr:PREDICTED: uncharacterized protein LOC108378368 [Rhagoletis zephyria]
MPSRPFKPVIEPSVGRCKPSEGSEQLATGMLTEPTRPMDLSCQASSSRAAMSTPLEGSSKAAPVGGVTGTREPCTGNRNANHKPPLGSQWAKHHTRPSGSGTIKRVRPAVRAKRVRRAASRLLKKFGDNPVPENMRDVVERAKGILSESRERTQEKGVLNNPEPTPSGSRELAPKRQLSADHADGPSKRTKTSSKNSPPNPSRVPRAFNDVAKDHLVLAVMDRGHPEGNLTAENWRTVLVGLCRVYKEILQRIPGPAPVIRDAGLYQGRIKLVSCADERSARLYKEAISALGELWPGADLVAVHRDEIPCRPRARAWVPEEPANPQGLLEIIQISNDTLPALDWSVVKASEVREQQRYITLVINEESLPILADCNGVISYGFYSITLKTQKGSEGKIPEPGSTASEPDNLPHEEGFISSRAENACQEVPVAPRLAEESDSTSESENDTQSAAGDGADFGQWTRDFENLFLASETEDADDTVVEVSKGTVPGAMDGDNSLEAVDEGPTD